MRQGTRTNLSPIGEKSQADAATLLNVGKRSVAGGSKTAPRGPFVEPRDTRPTLAEAGIDMKLSSRAQQLAKLPTEQFEKAVAHGRSAASRAVKTAVDHAT